MNIGLIKFGLLVKVVAGFYSGCYGTVLEDGKGTAHGIQVYASLTCKDGVGAYNNLSAWVELSAARTASRQELNAFLRVR